MTGFEQAIATGISWVIVLVWVGVMTYFIDLLAMLALFAAGFVAIDPAVSWAIRTFGWE